LQLILILVLTSQLALALADTENQAKYRKPLASVPPLETPRLTPEASPGLVSNGVSLANISDSRELVEDSTVSQQVLSPPLSPTYTAGMKGGVDAATAQYLLGVIEYNEGNMEAAKVWFQRAWEALEDNSLSPTHPQPLQGGEVRGTEAGKVTALPTSDFQIFSKSLVPTTSTAPAKIQFPEGYKVNVYYRDGWYIQPKDSSVGKPLSPPSLQRERELVYSFLPGSTYKIRVEAEEVGSRKSEVGSMNERINTGIKVIAVLVTLSWLMLR